MPTQNLGLVGVKSIYGRYLQAHDSDGELHASNPHRNEEETWFLIEVDKANHIYALQNWRNGNYMSKKAGTCAPADSTVLSKSEQWIVVSGVPFGVVNAVGFKSVVDGNFLGANPPGVNTNCGGEASAGDPSSPPVNSGGWQGWWVLEVASPPSQGRDPWNTIGAVFQTIAVQLAPIALDALYAALAV